MATPTGLYTLSLHDALPILLVTDLFQFVIKMGMVIVLAVVAVQAVGGIEAMRVKLGAIEIGRDTSELQSHSDLVCRLLLEKKKRERRCCWSGSFSKLCKNAR